MGDQGAGLAAETDVPSGVGSAKTSIMPGEVCQFNHSMIISTHYS
jgi:hypothetical protein